MIYLSVIIPTWNSEKTFSKTLESILHQTFRDFEILVIDGFSSDKTITIAKNYQDERIKIFSEKDNGIYDAMNKGVKLAKGEWIYFLGSDDKLYNNGVFEDISKLLYSKKSKAVYGNVVMKGDSIWAKDKHVYDGIFDMQKILRKNIAHQAIFYHKDLFMQIGKFNTKYKICADYDFNMQTMAKYRLQYTNIIVAEFSGGGASTADYDQAFAEDFYINVIKYFHSHLHKNFFFTYRHDIFKQGILTLRKNKLKGFRLILIALKFHLQHLFKRIHHFFVGDSKSTKAGVQYNQ